MNPPAKLSDLILALEIPSEEFRTYFDRKTGAVVSVEETMLSSLEDGEEEDYCLDSFARDLDSGSFSPLRLNQALGFRDENQQSPHLCPLYGFPD